MINRQSSLTVVRLCAVALSLSGCANFSADGGMSFIKAEAGGELGKDVVRLRTEADAAATQARVDALLKKPISDETAVQLALLNNRMLQAAYADLGFSEAQMVEATLPPSPTVSLGRMLTTGTLEIERSILQNVLGLLTLPRRKEIAEAKFQQAKVRAVEATLKTAADARRAYFRAVAANRTVAFLEEARIAAEAVSDLAKKLGETGAMSKLDQAREHAFTADVNGQLAMARLRQHSEREKFIRALGLWGPQTAFKLPSRLKPLPKAPRVYKDVETDAVKRRVDLELARQDLEILAKQHGLTKATRWIDVLEVKVMRNTEWSNKTHISLNTDNVPPTLEREIEREKESWRGIELEFRIPIFDFGEARTRAVEQQYMGAVHRLIARAIDVRSEAREAYGGYRGAYEIAMHYQKDVLPLRDIMNKEMLLNYNGMLKDLSSLLVDSRQRVMANIQAIEAQRDFWLAKVDLHVALVGGGALSGGGGQSAAAGGADEPAGH